MPTAKTLIRLGGCPGWSESSLGAHSFCWFCHVAAQFCLLPIVLGNARKFAFELKEIQATPSLSTSCISILPLMSKWFFIPNIFSLCFFAFQLCLCQKRLTWSNDYLEVIFHAVDVFSIIFATVYVEVKIGARMGVISSASAMCMY